jgi:hypothetical protein
MTLKSLAFIVTLASVLEIAHAQSASGGRSGKLLDVQETAVQFERVHRNGSKDWTTVELPSTRKQSSDTVRVALDGIIYTTRSSMIGAAEREARVEASTLVITHPDGRQYKPSITRRDHSSATDRPQERLR